MNIKYTQSFKIQAVEKALERANDVTVKNIADDLGVGHSTLDKWVALARQQKLEPMQDKEVTIDKRPQDWCAEEKLNIVISCASLDEEKVSELCREQGIFSHHINQWKQDFVNGRSANTAVNTRSDKKYIFLKFLYPHQVLSLNHRFI